MAAVDYVPCKNCVLEQGVAIYVDGPKRGQTVRGSLQNLLCDQFNDGSGIKENKAPAEIEIDREKITAKCLAIECINIVSPERR